LKLFHVKFEYTDTASVGTIIAASEAEAIAGAKKMVEGKVPGATNFKAEEITDENVPNTSEIFPPTIQ
jgi:hypothetical protein